MPIHIRPISDLRNKSLEISKLAHKHGTVFITRNGREDLVVMSMAMWEELFVLPGILEAEAEEARGVPAIPLEEALDALDRKLGYGKYRGTGKSGVQAQARRSKKT